MDKSCLLSWSIITYTIHLKPINTSFMKKVIVFRVENVLVKDFNKAESLDRAVAIETNKLKRSVGLDVLERELKKKGMNEEERELKKKECEKKWEEIEDKVLMKVEEKRKWVERREREFYDNEFERSKFKSGVGEIMRVLKGIKERMNVEIVFVSNYRKSKVERVLWNNGLREVEVESCSGCWVERIVEKSGMDRGDVVLISNNMGDLECGEMWGIKVERLNVEIEGIGGFMGKIGLKQCA